MLTTSTHDTKRSEDVRARLAAASQFPDQWRDAFARFRDATSRHAGTSGPSPNHQYLAFQTAVGAWPISAERLVEYLRKAAREEKRSTSWLDPDESYEKDLTTFARAVTEDPAVVAVVESFVDLVRRPGQVVALGQTLLKLTSPGVPDLYQGTEVWDLSLVDPDNRRPVDFDRLAGLLDEVSVFADADVPDVGRLLDAADIGLPKLWVTAMALATRRRHAEALGPTGAYEPILADGAGADDVIAFVRGGEVLPVVPRRIRDEWPDTSLVLPDGPWRDVLSGRRHAGGRTPVATLLERFPVALLTRMPEVP